MPVIDKLDPEGCIMYRLFRDSTLYKNGHHIKVLVLHTLHFLRFMLLE